MTRLHQTTDPAGPRILSYGVARGSLVLPPDDLVGPIGSSD